MGTNYSGTITGRITARVRTGGYPSDDGFHVIGLSGLKVRLREKDVEGYDYFGVDITDDDGTFDIQYNETQYLEGGEIELYLEILAEDGGTYEINTANHWNTTIKDKKYIGDYGTNENITYNLRLDEQLNLPDAYAPIHFTTNVYKYFSQNNVQISNRVRFRIGEFWFWQNYGDFANNYTSMGGLYPSTICLHSADESGLNEGTVRHEFGHVIMYKLQGNNIKIPYGVEGVNGHSWNAENTGLLAWIEGWANAIEMIMDAADYVEYLTNNQINDPEFGGEYVYLSNYENREEYSINNGLRSEYYIACAIYDLWDGPGKGLPNSLIPGSYVHSYNDANDWDDTNWNDPEIDDVEFSLAQICAPLQTINGNNLDDLRHIGHYLEKFIVNLDCESKAKVSKVFRQNKVLWDIDSYNNGLSVNGLTTDFLFDDINKHETGYFRMEFPLNTLMQTWTDIYFISLPNYRTHSHYFNACPNVSLAITDNYWIGYNSDGTLNGQNNIYLNSQDAQCNNATTGVFYTCGGVDLIIRNGKIELGKTDGSKTAELEINDGSILDIQGEFGKFVVNSGSVLRINDGGTLIINDDGILEVNGIGEVIIEEGGQIIYNNGTIIELNDSNSTLEIAGDLHIDPNAIFTFTGDGYIKFSNLGGDATNNIFCGSGASIVLQGSGQTDKIMEVQQSTVRFPAELSSLELRDGKIEMGTNARLLNEVVSGNENYPITLDNIKITSDNGTNNNHRSYVFWGQPNITVNDCVFEYGQYGLYNYTYWGSPLTVTNSTFRDNQTGLYMYDKGLTLTNCDFNNNTGNAIHCENMSMLSDFSDCTVTANNYGVVYQGSSNADLSIDNSDISYNTQTGVKVNGAFDLDLTCNTINNNRYGVYTQNGTYLRMENFARNDVSDNQKSLYLNYGRLFLQDGYNQLQSINDDYAVYGYAVERANCGTPINVSAIHNRWEDNTSATPLMNSNYALWVYNCWPPTNVILGDALPSYQVCIQFVPLGSNQIESDQTSSELSIESNENDIEAQVISMSLEAAELTSESEINAMISQYISFLSGNTDSYGILSSSVANKAWADMHDLVDKYYKVVDLDSENIGFNQSIDQVMQLNEQLMLDADAIAYYEYALDNALLERLRGNFDESLLLLDNLIPELEGMDKETAYVNRWICYIEAEREAALRNITPEEFLDAVAICNINYENALENLSENLEPDESAEETSTAPEIHIVPNPNNGNFTLEISDCKEGGSVRISNVYSQPLFTKTFTESGTQTVQITGLSQGHYTVYYLENNTVISSENIVVE